MDRVRARVVIRGRVQGVGFRQSTAHEATAVGLMGWVRNLPDGTVEAVFQGERAAVEHLLRWCERGPGLAHVELVLTAWEAPVADEHPFDVR